MTFLQAMREAKKLAMETGAAYGVFACLRAWEPLRVHAEAKPTYRLPYTTACGYYYGEVAVGNLMITEKGLRYVVEPVRRPRPEDFPF